MIKARLVLHALPLWLVATLCLSSCATPPAAIIPTTTLTPLRPTPTLTIVAPPTSTSAPPSPRPLPSPTSPSSPLSEWPLNLGNYWVYSSTVYVENNSANYTITDTVVETQVQENYFIAGVRRDIYPALAEPYFTGSISPGIHWYIISGTLAFRQDGKLAPEQVDSSWLEYVFPFSEHHCWFQSPYDRREFDPERCNTGSRGLLEVNVPAGNFQNCYPVVGMYLSGGTQSWFCPGTGVVKTKYDHNGSPFGYEEALIDYLPK